MPPELTYDIAFSASNRSPASVLVQGHVQRDARPAGLANMAMNFAVAGCQAHLAGHELMMVECACAKTSRTVEGMSTTNSVKKPTNWQGVRV